MLLAKLSLCGGLATQLSLIVSAVALNRQNVDNVVSRAPSTFTHPGVLLDRNQLEFIREKVNAGAQPWAEAFDDMLRHELASPSRQPKPTTTVECGPSSTPNLGCSDEREDALAAYANALAWFIKKDQKFAEKAIGYMDAWASTIKAHTNHNAPLQAGWSASSWARAAEIIRYTDAGWTGSGISAFETMLRQVYLPVVIVGSNNNGNWELCMLDCISLQMISTFTITYISHSNDGGCNWNLCLSGGQKQLR
jgi:hypothetical protein